MASAAIPTTRATTSLQARPICARCSTATAMSARCLRPITPAPAAMTSTARRAARFPPRHAPMSPRSPRSLAARLHRMRRCNHRHRRPTGARHRYSSCARTTRELPPRRRPRCKQATAALPFRRATPPVRSRRTAVFSWRAPATGERHEGGVHALGRFGFGIRSGRFLPGWIPDRRGRKGRKGGGQD
ncbi:hypothetical protein WP8S18E04_17780 [Aeromonas caviae]|nr:hypothetical protein WP8S18E04_17780 [Aeromonas caviae]